ncbi:ABC transporter permease [Solibaculum intestinale]|uniref:ABC transporter permease n=1 Tax=Solibaculum intestinale TaxID=3133165 RepID=A0ABV1E2M9_9FIRM
MKQFWIVFQHEYVGFLKNKVYAGVTIFLVLAIAVVLSLPNLFSLFSSGDSPATPPADAEKPVVLVDAAAAGDGYAAYLSSVFPDYAFEEKDTAGLDLKALINDGDYEGAVVFQSPMQYEFYTKRLGIAGSSLLGGLSEAVTMKMRTDALTALGVTEQEAAQIMTAQPQQSVIETGKSFMDTYFYTYALLFILYLSVILYGQMVASAVAAEKSNRAMEMLITTASPNNLMFGKIMGVGLAGLTQVAVILLAAFGFYQLNASAWDNEIIQSLFNMPVNIMLFTLLFYLLGFFLYAFLFGAVGSLVSRTEDVNTTITPMMLLLVGAFFLSLYAMLGNPDSPLVVVCSFIPFFTPMLMFVRICMTDVPTWQILLSVVLTVVFTGFMGWLSAKIYRVGVLMYGKPPKPGELIRVLKDSKHY